MRRPHLLAALSPAALLLLAVAVAWSLGRAECYAPAGLLALLLLGPVARLAATGRSGLPPRTNALALGLRALVVVLLALGLADLQAVRRHDGLCTFFLLDHSASIPDAVIQQEFEYVNAASATMGRHDAAGIVVFAEDASVEHRPVHGLNLERVYSAVNRDYTDAGNAVELAVAAFPEGLRRKLVLVTDGNENKGNLLDALRLAAAHGVETDILPVTFTHTNEVMVEKLYVPDRVREKEPFDVRAHILAQRDGPAELTLYRNGTCIAREALALHAGRNTYAATLKLDEPGFYAFAARIAAPGDGIARNNEAGGYVYIQGASRILMVAPNEREVASLARACREDGLEVDIVAPDDFPDSLGGLQNHDCIVLANVPADAFSENRMTLLQADVRDLGAGLVMIGGPDSFGAGGYGGTPVEEALPVSMDIRQKKINPKGALVLVLHTCEFADGNYWAKQITKKAIETVNSQDEVGVLLYGQSEQWLFTLRPARDKPALYRLIDQATPGDMPSFEPTLRLAYAGLAGSDAMVKHIIIISDGDPASPQPQLIKDLAAAGITISTVAINPHSPRDTDVMKYIAYQTGGRYYLAADPSVLPHIFVKEAQVVNRSLIFNRPFTPQLVQASELTKGIDPRQIPQLLAYVATTPKPAALVPLVSDNENRDPVLACWRYGLGKATAFTSDATSNWGKPWLAWDQYKRFWTQTLRWTSRKRERSDVRLHKDIAAGRGRLTVDAIDPQGRFINFLRLTGRIVGPDAKGEPLAIRQVAPGRYEAEFDAHQAGVSIINVGYQDPESGRQGFAATGVAVPYSPEYRELSANLPRLRQAALAGNGRLLSGHPEADQVFTSRQPPNRSFRPLWGPLLSVSLALFLIDVLIRRVTVNRTDLVAARARLRTLLTRRRGPPGERDAMVDALLRRKAAALKPPSPDDNARAAAFKRKLDEATDRAGPLAPPVETAAPRRDGTPPAAEPPAEAPAPAPPAATGGNAYTERLLAAKKRARHPRDTAVTQDSTGGETP